MSMFKCNKYLLWTLIVITQMCAALASNNTWSCSDTESIPRTKLCDGFVDCSNRRDETALECATELCSEDEYRCAYGACIKAELKCNKEIDCYDRSDETDFLCDSEEEVYEKIKGHCSDNKFQCVSGECIEEMSMCDGIADCSDSSDETVESCAHLECSSLSFRCGYGACISIDQVRDEIWDCVDGSDEPQLVESKPSSPETDVKKQEQEKTEIETCSIPYQNTHLQISLIKAGIVVKPTLSYFDKVLRHDSVQFHCLPGFELKGVDHLECIDNDWYHQWPHCERSTNLVKCRANETSCDNGDCINPVLLCNGAKDCRDGSDEAPSKCLNKTCTESEYKCKYGGCISKHKLCDNHKHCADGSDETTLLCTHDEESYSKILQGSCESEVLVQCRSKECIAFHELCDGIPDCSDGSDESVEMCAHIQCSDSSFTCAYGGCVPYYVQCNGEADCADGSDEIAEICAPIVIENQKYEDIYNYDDNVNTNIDQYEIINEKRNFVEKAIKEKIITTKGPEADNEPVVVIRPLTIRSELSQKRCTIPPNRVALRVINEAQNITIKVGGQVDAHEIVNFSCEDTWYLVDGKTEALCMPTGEWSTTVPRCEKRCAPQWSGISTHTTCLYKNISTDCQTLHSKPETKALIQCALGYKEISKKEEIICGDDGEWSKPKFKCSPQCVKLGADTANKSEVLVKIFRLGFKGSNSNDLQYELACVGTIISPKLILTSALCFSTNKLNNRIAANDPILYTILPAATKIESFGQYEQPPGRHNVSQIFIAESKTDDNIDTPSIAVLADYFVIIPNEIMPICLEFSRACLNHKIIETTEPSVEGTTTLKGNGCFVLAGLTKYIFMDEYQQWLEKKVMLHKYIL